MKAPHIVNKNRRSLTVERLAALLARFAEDGDGEKKYKELWRKLERHFYLKGLSATDAAADETLDCVARILEDGKEEIHDVDAFAIGVANRIFFARQKSERNERAAGHVFYALRENNDDEEEDSFETQARCFNLLTDAEKNLLIDYYAEYAANERHQKRKEIADRLGISYDLLRQKAARLRRKLEISLEKETNDNS